MLILTTNPGHSLPNVTPYRDAMGKERPDKPFIVRDRRLSHAHHRAGRRGAAGRHVVARRRACSACPSGATSTMPKIVEPPGEARSDFDILLDLAGRLEKAGVVAEGLHQRQVQDAPTTSGTRCARPRRTRPTTSRA